MIENILKNNDEIYRNHKPSFEFNLYNDELCYIAEVVVEADAPEPGDVLISLKDHHDSQWRRVLQKKSSKDPGKKTFRYVLPGEQYSRYLQIKFLNNSLGRNFVGIRRLVIRGLKKDNIVI